LLKAKPASPQPAEEKSEKSDKSESIDPVMKQYMAMVQQQKAAPASQPLARQEVRAPGSI